MAQVLISYSSADRERAKELQQQIEAYDVTVWLDQQRLTGGKPFHREIAQAIKEAQAVVVIWSPTAVESDWVYAEAQRGKRQKKIVSVRIEPEGGGLELPLPFDALHTIRIERIDDILRSINERVAGGELPVAENRRQSDINRDILDSKFDDWIERYASTSPSAMLNARHALVDFDDVHGLRTQMIEWATSTPQWADGRTALARLIHGPGGLGKTRLMMEVCRNLFDLGWVAGFIPREVFTDVRRREALSRLIEHRRDANGLMLVIDYAEGLPRDALIALAEEISASTAKTDQPCRLVLLARAAGQWWSDLYNSNDKIRDLAARAGGPDSLAVPATIELGARIAMFDAAEKCFREKIDAYRTGQGMDPLARHEAALDDIESLLCDDQQKGFDRPLAIHMMALLHAMGATATAAHEGIPGLLGAILGYERAHWRKITEIKERTNAETALHRALAQVTAVMRIEESEAADALVSADPLYKDMADTDALSTRRHVDTLLPAPGIGLIGLEPDLIGEHHVAEKADDRLVEACLSWASEDRDARRRILTVLNRATRAEHGAMGDKARATLNSAIDLLSTEHTELGAAAAAIEDLVIVTLTSYGRLEEALDKKFPNLLPKRTIHTLRIVAARVDDGTEMILSAAKVIAQILIAPGTSDHQGAILADRMIDDGIRLIGADRVVDGRELLVRGLEAYEELCRTVSKSLLVLAARALLNASARHELAGARGLAIEMAEMSVEINRRIEAASAA